MFAVSGYKILFDSMLKPIVSWSPFVSSKIIASWSLYYHEVALYHSCCFSCLQCCRCTYFPTEQRTRRTWSRGSCPAVRLFGISQAVSHLAENAITFGVDLVKSFFRDSITTVLVIPLVFLCRAPISHHKQGQCRQAHHHQRYGCCNRVNPTESFYR